MKPEDCIHSDVEAVNAGVLAGGVLAESTAMVAVWFCDHRTRAHQAPACHKRGLPGVPCLIQMGGHCAAATAFDESLVERARRDTA